VSNGPDLRISRSLELLGSLKQTAARFAKREAQIARDFAGRRYAANKTSTEALAETESTYSAHLTQAEEYFRAQDQHVRSVYDARRARIQRLHISILKNLPDRAQEAKRRWLGDLQMKKYEAQRKLPLALEAADAEYLDFTSKLETYRVTLAELERRARKAFRGYWTLRRLLPRKRGGESPADAASSGHIENISGHLENAQEKLLEFRRFGLPRFFAAVPLSLFFVLIFGGATALAWHLGLVPAQATSPATLAIAGGAVVLFGLIWLVHFFGLGKARPTAAAIADALAQAHQIIDGCGASGPALAATREEMRRRIEEEHERINADIEEQWTRADDVELQFVNATRKKVDMQVPRIFRKIDVVLSAKLQAIEAERAGWQEQLQNDGATLRQQMTEKHAAEVAAMVAEEKAQWDGIEADWKAEIVPIYQAIDAINTESSARFPAWDAALVHAWMPHAEFTPATRFGHLDLDLAKTPAALPRDPRLALPGPAKVSLPLALSYPDQGSLLFETRDSGDAAVVGALNNIVLRILSTTPPGKLSFTIIDPVGLGQSFAGFMHLADYEESLINRRIWTQRDQIEERLAELGEHIEKVIQMYLRNEYETITEFNAQAGSVAEKYHFLVVADFPANFSEVAAKRLQSIAQSGPRCGVFLLIHWDQRQPLPDGFVADELRKNSTCIRRTAGGWELNKQQAELDVSLALDPPPDADLAAVLVHKIGQSSIDSNRVEVPFSQIAPKPDAMWSLDTTSELRIPVGRTGATKLQYLAIGKGTRQHALFAGKTGSGKSTLFHVIITNLALACSPEQVEFYLIDFKKGVEFKCYATKHLPHAKVVAIESDREFALSVLQRVDDELRRRGDMFRKLGVQDIPGYKRAGGAEPMPRTLLIIDEFQEFFVADDSIAQTASLLFDRIVRQGRAFGIHVLLGSQTLGGSYSLARATLGQMVIRVALQCNEADSYLIMDENNPAPRLLSRPGEGIYNDAAGAIEGNSPFQVVWLPDEERDTWLDKVGDLAVAHQRHYPSPIVFEGNAPADIRENDLLRSALDAAPAAAPPSARCWLGAPNSIKGPTEVVFQRQSGSHLLIVGQRDEASLMMLGVSMLSLAAQFPKGAAKFVLIHGAIPGTSEARFLEQIIKAIPHEIVVAQAPDVSSVINDLAGELKTRNAGETSAHDAPAIFIFILGLHKFKKLRQEDDFSFSVSADAGPNPGAQFNQLITEGSSQGMHIITTVDTLNSVNRFMNRKALSEFEMRVVFQMSGNDSASLIDSPKAGELGLHRAIFYNEHEGYLETFRPYASPDAEWLAQVAGKLSQR
jgi:S-DNA-T family DNA segregation ATPase FtsK/SpoIIIE